MLYFGVSPRPSSPSASRPLPHLALHRSSTTMSDLDADLYGGGCYILLLSSLLTPLIDLYGNDDDGFQTAEASKDTAKLELEDTTDIKPLPVQDEKPPMPAVPLPTAASAPAKLANGAPPLPAKLPALNPPPAQPIQTYQQQQYDEPPVSRPPIFNTVAPALNDPNAQLDGDRAVRPSEMKDEG